MKYPIHLYTENNRISLFNQENTQKKTTHKIKHTSTNSRGGGLWITKITSISPIVVTSVQRGY